LEPLQVVEVKARVSGELLKLHFKAGAAVKKGDLLFEIDGRPMQADLDRAQASLRLAEVKKKLADADLKRAQRLVAAGGGVISKEDIDKAAADAAVAEAASHVAQADVERAKLMLDFTKVTAPISGRIGEPQVTPGNQVAGTPGRATVLATIKTLDPIGVAFDVDERSFLRYQRLVREHKVKGEGSALFVRLAGEEGPPHEGKLKGFSDHVNPTTGTVQVRGFLPNPDQGLLPGMFVRVRMPFGKPRAVLEVPEDAIFPAQDKPYALVVNGRHDLEKRELVIGPTAEHDMRVIEKGLSPEDWVVVSNGARLRAGDHVKPERKAPPKGSDTNKK
jgi:RND family efflux transporter MFP subunit